MALLAQDSVGFQDLSQASPAAVDLVLLLVQAAHCQLHLVVCPKLLPDFANPFLAEAAVGVEPDLDLPSFKPSYQLWEVRVAERVRHLAYQLHLLQLREALELSLDVGQLPDMRLLELLRKRLALPEAQLAPRVADRRQV